MRVYGTLIMVALDVPMESKKIWRQAKMYMAIGPKVGTSDHSEKPKKNREMNLSLTRYIAQVCGLSRESYVP